MKILIDNQLPVALAQYLTCLGHDCEHVGAVNLDAGASEKVHFELKPRDLSMVTEAGDPKIVQGKYTLSVGGGQPHTSAPVVTKTFRINGELVLPE